MSMYVAGIGKQVDKMELEAIASRPASKYVFMIDNFDALNEIKDQLAIKACKGKLYFSTIISVAKFVV